MYTLGAGRILIKSIIIVCLLNLLAWKASWAHRTGEKKEDNTIKKSLSKRRAPVPGPVWKKQGNDKWNINAHHLLDCMILRAAT